MYTKNEIHELRDTLIAERNANQYIGAPQGRTAIILYETLTTFGSDGEEIRKVLLQSRNNMSDDHETTLDIINDRNYALAHDILFGDIELAPLHFNDALASVATWRLEHPYNFIQK
jgi:hypothetical protein